VLFSHTNMIYFYNIHPPSLLPFPLFLPTGFLLPKQSPFIIILLLLLGLDSIYEFKHVIYVFLSLVYMMEMLNSLSPRQAAISISITERHLPGEMDTISVLRHLVSFTCMCLHEFPLSVLPLFLDT
jgi:hypothetical protein